MSQNYTELNPCTNYLESLELNGIIDKSELIIKMYESAQVYEYDTFLQPFFPTPEMYKYSLKHNPMIELNPKAQYYMFDIFDSCCIVNIDLWNMVYYYIEYPNRIPPSEYTQNIKNIIDKYDAKISDLIDNINNTNLVGYSNEIFYAFFPLYGKRGFNALKITIDCMYITTDMLFSILFSLAHLDFSDLEHVEFIKKCIKYICKMSQTYYIENIVYREIKSLLYLLSEQGIDYKLFGNDIVNKLDNIYNQDFD